MKNITCCFTGHREIPVDEIERINERLIIELEKLISSGIIYFEAGGALGFDTLAAVCVIKLRKIHPQIKLVLVLPNKDQCKYWDKEDRDIYNKILSEADNIIYTSDKYFTGCMHKRNRHLVDTSDYCVCYCSYDKGGTAYTVRYAMAYRLNIINIK